MNPIPVIIRFSGVSDVANSATDSQGQFAMALRRGSSFAWLRRTGRVGKLGRNSRKRGAKRGQFLASQPMAADTNFSISSIKTEKLGRSKRISGAGIRLCLMLGGRCL
jgi:hypothetical protein